MVSLEFFIDIILPVALWPLSDSASNRNEYQEYFLWGKGGRCVGLTNITTFMCRLSRNSGSLKLRELSRPVQACNGIALSLPINKAFVIWVWRFFIYSAFLSDASKCRRLQSKSSECWHLQNKASGHRLKSKRWR